VQSDAECQKEQHKMAVYAYVRVSTQAQADEGESLGTQQRMIQGYALQHGWTIDEILIERGVSGSTPLGLRPEGGRLIDRLQPGDIVLTPKLDRMFRSALDALEILRRLQAQGVNLHMIDLGGDVTGNGISKLVFTILSAVAEAERDRIKERIRDIKRDQKSRGLHLGGKRPPFGQRLAADGLHLEDDPKEQAAIDTMINLRGAGHSFQKIAATVKARHAIAINPAVVNRVLQRRGIC
jgi:DNA invertase Pin-like site-specific DNA recombinase